MNSGTVALVLRNTEESPSLVETISDDMEIELLEAVVAKGHPNPLQKVHEFREKQTREDEEFGNYVEDLLSQGFVKPEIQEHAVQWLKSKIRIEEYRQSEETAAQTIAKYAYQLFVEDPSKTDFYLSGPTAKVRIRIFLVENAQMAA